MGPLTGGQRATLTGDLDQCFCGAAFSPDGQLLAAASSDGQVPVWDTKTGRRQASLLGGKGPTKEMATCVAFHPSGKWLAAGYDGAGVVRLWDLETGTMRRTLPLLATVTRVAFSPDGTRLAAGGTHRGQVRVWDAASGQELGAFDTADATADDLSYPRLVFSPQANTLLVANGPRLTLWEPGHRENEIGSGLDTLLDLAVSPNGWFVAVSGVAWRTPPGSTSPGRILIFELPHRR